jgi:hypothetical protein
MEPEEKELFELAASRARRSLNAWLVIAGLEKAARDGVALPAPAPKAKKGGGR